MSLFFDIAYGVVYGLILASPAYLAVGSYRRKNRESTPLERERFKQLRKDIKTIRKSQPKSKYQSLKLLEDIFQYMPTRSWDFDGHTEFGKDQKQYHWSAPALRRGKLMTVTIAWNTKWSSIEYIVTHVKDTTNETYSPGNAPSEIDLRRAKENERQVTYSPGRSAF